MFKQDQIAAFFSRSTFDKARAYHAQRRVGSLEFNEDLTEISAAVQGSYSNVYSVEIGLRLKNGKVAGIDGACSCPMGLNCKHVAATLLEVIRREAGKFRPVAAMKPGAASQSMPQPVAQVLPYDVSAWLDKISAAMRGDDYPADVSQRLLYAVQPLAQGLEMPHLAVSLLSVRLRKDGEFAGTASRPSLSDFGVTRAPKFYRDADIDILSRLSREKITYGRQDAYPIVAVDILQKILATGRAYWLDHKGAPLRWGEGRHGRIEWRTASAAGVRPYLVVEGAVALNAEPPVYVDEAAGLIGTVELGVPARLAHQLLTGPAIARAQVTHVAHRLGLKLPAVHHHLLPAAPEPAMKIAEHPMPVLTLRLGRAAPHGYYYTPPDGMPVAHLVFRYGPIEIERSETAAKVEAFRDGRVYEVSRHRALETEALKRLTDSGLVEANQIYPGLDDAHRHDLTFAASQNWLDFLNRRAADLRSAGFDIRIDDNFPYRLATSPGVFQAEFESSGIDWFELGVGIEIDGERHDLAPVLAALVSTPGFSTEAIKTLAEGDGDFYLPLADGRHLALAAGRFLPIILALHALNLNGRFVEGSEKTRLSRAEIMPFLGLDDRDIVFRGMDNLRQMAGLLHTQRLADPELPPGFKASLRPYQAQGVAWLDLLRACGLGGILADDMGLGKTVQVLALLAMEKARGGPTDPTLIVAPTSLMANWFGEAQKFMPDIKALVLHGTARKQAFAAIPDHDIVLTTYPLIARDHEILLTQDWHMAILDEAQTIKNPNAVTTRWLRDIKAKHRFCLTGTPMENHLGELWSLMSFVNPGYLGDKAAFARQWRTPIEKRGDAGRSMALAQRVKPFMLRRTKTEVATELPPKSEIVESIVLEGGQKDIYDSIRISMSAKVRKAIKDRGLGRSHIVVLEALMKLRQACCDPALLKLDDGVERPSAKLDRLMEMVVELLSEGRKIIIFSQFTSMLELIRVRLDGASISYSLLTGDTKDRPAAINRFQRGASDVFLISLKAGGVGLNLTAADTVIIFDPWWNPAVEEQAIDRAYRIGQDKAVFVYRLVAVGTIEEKMDALKAKKRALADSLFDRDGGIGAALTEEDVKALFE